MLLRLAKGECDGKWDRRDLYLSSNPLYEPKVLRPLTLESFLKKFCVMFKDIDYFGPEFCYVEHYAQLRGLEPLIKAVEKGGNKTR